jgi:hypothetical protein
MMDEIECTCGWSGYVEELVCSEDDDKSDKRVEDIKFNVCPQCGESEGITDIEE